MSDARWYAVGPRSRSRTF